MISTPLCCDAHVTSPIRRALFPGQGTGPGLPAILSPLCPCRAVESVNTAIYFMHNLACQKCATHQNGVICFYGATSNQHPSPSTNNGRLVLWAGLFGTKEKCNRGFELGAEKRRKQSCNLM